MRVKGQWILPTSSILGVICRTNIGTGEYLWGGVGLGIGGLQNRRGEGRSSFTPTIRRGGRSFSLAEEGVVGDGSTQRF